MLKKESDLLTCANCGKRIRWDDSFCSSCGSKVKQTENSSIDLPRLSESVGKLELWGRESKEISNDNVTDSNTTPETTLRTVKQTDQEKKTRTSVRLFDKRWRKAWLERYRVSPGRESVLSGLVLTELLVFFPYVFMVICVFQYNFLCAVLTISSAVVLLTHGVCVGASYCSIFTYASQKQYVEVSKAADSTHSLLKWGATFVSIFLLAFFVCLSYNDAARQQPNPAADFVPASFDD